MYTKLCQDIYDFSRNAIVFVHTICNTINFKCMQVFYISSIECCINIQIVVDIYHIHKFTISYILFLVMLNEHIRIYVSVCILSK